MLETESRCFVRKLEGLFDGPTMARVRAHFVAAEEAGRAPPGSDRERRFRAIGVACDALRFDPCWYDLWRDADADLIGRIEPYTWVIYPVLLRHLTAESHLVPWHQDIGYQRLLGARAHARVITCFVPLEPDPTDCATLEFALGEFAALPHERAGDHGAVIAGARFRDTARFELAFGDALVFGDHVPHRTVPGRGGRIDRRSFEFRLVLPEEAIDGKDYFDVAADCFTRRDGQRREAP